MSIALVDWPAMDGFCALLEGWVAGRDPFTALAGFSTVLGALIFYDRVLVLDYPDPVGRRLTDRAGQLLDADPVIFGIEPPQWFRVGSRPQLVDSRRRLDDLPWASLADLDDATRTEPAWFSALRQRWSRLLPHVHWPDHSLQAYEEAFPDNRGPGVSPALLSQAAYPMSDLFALGATSWTLNDLHGELGDVVRVNNARALYYCRLAASVKYALSRDQSVDVRYVGGPLRTPMLASLSDLARASLQPGDATRIEDWLDNQWRALHPGERFAVRLPLWLEAVLSRAATRADVPEVVAEFRHIARALRRRKRELEQQVAEGDRPAISRLAVAMAADAAKLAGEVEKRAEAGLQVVDVGVRAATGLPAGPKFALSTLSAAAGQERMGALRIRLFHPELRCVYKLGNHADKLANSLPRAFETFELTKADSTEPMHFLSQLGETTAVI